MGEAINAVQQNYKTFKTGWAPTSKAMHMAMGTNSVELGSSPRGGAAAADLVCKEEVRTDLEKAEMTWEARDIMMTETKTKTATTVRDWTSSLNSR